jgi:hemoglobin/transferrin/lactoferrin receptor protein
VSTTTLDRDRLTWSARYLLDATLADSIQTVLSWQNSAARQAGQTVRNDGGVRMRDTSYSERSWQAGLQAYKLDQLNPTWSHRTTYGFDHASIDVSSLADGRDPTPPGPYVPKHYFPDTRDSSDALFVQSELTDDTWSITLGVRLDHYALDVRSQAGYYPTASATPGKSLSGSAVSPRLGVMLQATPEWSLWGNYASGFRAPEAQQVNNVFEGFNARLLPNPNLEPEKSRNFELGARLRGQRHLLDLALFTSRYSNLIVEKKNLGTVLPGPPSATNPTLFQTVNVGRASISGFEVKGMVDWGRAAGGEFSMPFAYGRVRGTDETTGLPLNAVDPPKFALGLKYDSPAWMLRLDLLHRVGKSVDDLDSPLVPRSTTLQFTPPSATTLDLTGQWRVSSAVRFGFAVTNLTDKKFWNWSDVQGLASNGTPVVVDAYSQPGRSLAVSLVADF